VVIVVIVSVTMIGIMMPSVFAEIIYPTNTHRVDAPPSYCAVKPSDTSYLPRFSIFAWEAEVEEAVGKILSNIINSTGLDTDVYVRDQMEEGSIVFELEGKDSGLLIGRRGETLSSIEYLVRLIASKNLDKRANVMLDVEDYKLRRKEKVASIADSTAEKVIQTGKRISLEPMSASDRRIVHMTLADNDQIETQSKGEGLQRKVIINPKD